MQGAAHFRWGRMRGVKRRRVTRGKKSKNRGRGSKVCVGNMESGPQEREAQGGRETQRGVVSQERPLLSKGGDGRVLWP